MKKEIWVLFLFVCVTSLLLSCNEEDDKTPAGVGYLANGKRLKSLECTVPVSMYFSSTCFFKYEYTDDELVKVDCNSGTYEVCQDPFSMIREHSEWRNDDSIFCEINNKGLISQIKMIASTPINEIFPTPWRSQSQYDISYNKNNQISQIYITSHSIDDTDESRDTSVVDFFYNGKVLDKMVENYKSSFISDGEVTLSDKTYTTTFMSTKHLSNKYQQYTPAVASLVMPLYSCESLVLLGMLGKATSVLPDSISCYFVDNLTGEEEDDIDCDSFDYELNEDGSIHYGNGYLYDYSE